MVARRLMPLIVALVPLAAQAQKDLASCKTLFDASAKRATTSFHAYVTSPAIAPGTWKRSPVTAAVMAQQEQENMQSATVISCRHVRDESVGGANAAVYSSHVVNEGMTFDGQAWIAQGLVIRTESDMDTGDGAKSHITTRFEYANVHAPAGVP